MAVSMTADVIDYCVSNGSPVYVCALDAEGAFDGIPHSMMFFKALGIIPMLYLRLLIYWYSRLVVFVRWGRYISQPIVIKKGTRQGGLSSPFIFNLLYQDLIEELSNMDCGISVGGTTYNLCCYADDILLCSLTTAGLQRLIDAADKYITEHGLRFNPLKTTCVTFGKSPFPNKRWHLQNTPLSETSHVKHLGVILANDDRSHAESRIQAAHRAFCSLQGAGLCVRGCNPRTIAYMYTTAIRPILTFGLECVHQCKTALKEVEKMQSKLLKAALGLKTHCKTSPLLQALCVDSIATVVDIQKLSLFRTMLMSSSRTSTLCKFLLKGAMQGTLKSSRSLASTVLNICEKYGFSFVNYVCSSSLSLLKGHMKFKPPCGIADSVKYALFTSGDVATVNSLLSPF